ncbi:MAG TPA: ATP-binding protein [Longimicrobiales bacterium]
MTSLPSLRRELVVALAIIFAGALLVAVSGVILLLPRFATPGAALGYVLLLLVADVLVFALFGRFLVQRRILAPLDEMIAGAEAIAGGEYGHRLPAHGSAETARLADAVNRMAERLIAHREQLAENVRSLQETNVQLTEARDELIQVEKMASVGRLAAGIAHEVGNPLSAVIGYLGILERGADPEARELVGAATREAQRIDRIVRGLLDYARPREARVHPIEVNEVTARAVELLSTQGRFQHIEVGCELAASPPQIEADPYQLEQVVVNLLLNAADALDGVEAPAIIVRTGHRHLAPVRPSSTRRKDDPPDVDYSHRRRFHQRPRIPRDNPFPAGGEVVEISVQDNGPGIPAKLLDQIFEPFVTTKAPGQGTGLGLAVSARLIDAMGGTIRAENVDGGGARFTIILPAARVAALEPHES